MSRPHVGVVIPARNESRLVSSCIRSVLWAAQEAGVSPLIALVDDGSTDDTASRARSTIPHGLGCVYSVIAGNAGAARALGVEKLAKCSPVKLEWVATTDADSVVPADWFSRQLQHFRSGADAVAGLVDLSNSSPGLRRAFRDSYFRNVTSLGHPHVHGANLGLRLESCLAVGNFRPIPCGEDQDIWHRLMQAGCTMVSDSRSVVTTSSRFVNRAEGGFAAGLRTLAEGLRQDQPSRRHNDSGRLPGC
jgi:glycosyltransferase involved in cell wall biosynthesis